MKGRRARAGTIASGYSQAEVAKQTSAVVSVLPMRVASKHSERNTTAKAKW